MLSPLNIKYRNAFWVQGCQRNSEGKHLCDELSLCPLVIPDSLSDAEIRALWIPSVAPLLASSSEDAAERLRLKLSQSRADRYQLSPSKKCASKGHTGVQSRISCSASLVLPFLIDSEAFISPLESRLNGGDFLSFLFFQKKAAFTHLQYFLLRLSMCVCTRVEVSAGEAAAGIQSLSVGGAQVATEMGN